MSKNCPLDKEYTHACCEGTSNFGDSCIDEERHEAREVCKLGSILQTKKASKEDVAKAYAASSLTNVTSKSESVYEEKQIGTATTVNELIQLLSGLLPLGATVDVAASCHMSDAEVWYDEGTNTVILK